MSNPKPIRELNCKCNCGWSGILDDCEIDEDDNLLCPKCFEMIEVENVE